MWVSRRVRYADRKWYPEGEGCYTEAVPDTSRRYGDRDWVERTERLRREGSGEDRAVHLPTLYPVGEQVRGSIRARRGRRAPRCSEHSGRLHYESAHL